MEYAVRFLGGDLTRDQVTDAIRRFDRQFAVSNDHDGWLDKSTYVYAIRSGGRLYPPKLIVSWATGIDRDRFNGGSQTNNPLRRLGFEVIEKPSDERA